MTGSHLWPSDVQIEHLRVSVLSSTRRPIRHSISSFELCSSVHLMTLYKSRRLYRALMVTRIKE